MFYKFNAHRSAPAKSPPDQKQALARRIFQKATGLQRRWACFMQSQSERLSAGWLKALCLTVLTGSFTYSTYLLFDGMLSVPKLHIDFSSERLWPFDPHGTKAAARKKAALEIYLDSLDQVTSQDSLKHLPLKP